MSTNPLLEARDRVRSLGRKRVLVVDDERDPREFVIHVLERAGLDVREAEGVDEAIEILVAEDVDILISDVGMPEIDGHALIRRLRVSEHWSALPAVAVSGFVQPEDRHRALLAGFNEHFGKPCDPTTLLHAVRALLAPTGSE